MAQTLPGESSADMIIKGSDRDRGEISDCFDDYWRQDTYARVSKAELVKRLDAVGHYIPRSYSNQNSLATYLQRFDQGCPCYFTCTTDELQKFVTARGLEVESSRRARATKLRTALENADAQRPFHKFMDLAPELRNRVYAFYMSEFNNNVLLAPTQPPLTQASSLIRQEALPVFYKTCKFTLALKHASCYGLKWDEDSDRFIKSLQPSSLAMVRNIQFQIFDRDAIMPDDLYNGMYNFAIDVQLGNGRKPCTVDLLNLLKADKERWDDYKDFEKEAEALENDVKAVFEAVSRRVDSQTGERVHSLTIEDLWTARRKMEPSFVKYV